MKRRKVLKAKKVEARQAFDAVKPAKMAQEEVYNDRKKKLAQATRKPKKQKRNHGAGAGGWDVASGAAKERSVADVLSTCNSSAWRYKSIPVYDSVSDARAFNAVVQIEEEHWPGLQATADAFKARLGVHKKEKVPLRLQVCETKAFSTVFFAHLYARENFMYPLTLLCVHIVVIEFVCLGLH